MRTKHSKGQGLVEFALILPLLVTLLLGLTDLGFLLYTNVQVTNAAREAARAGSLYLGDRFHYTACYSDCEPGYGTGGDCWPLRDWVENALVERNRSSDGCPAAGFNAGVTSLGILQAEPCASATSGIDCWWLQPVTSNGAAIAGLPIAGNPLEVRLVYRFVPPLLGDFIGLEQNPISIARTVIMKVQNN